CPPWYLAAYGAIQREQGEDAAQTFLFNHVNNIVSLVGGGREASDAFIQNQVGDALVTFEAELINVDSAFPNEYPVIMPDSTLITEFPAVVIDEVVDRRGTREIAEAFIEFLFSPLAQQFYAITGYRPVNERILSLNTKYREIAAPFSIEDLGGWDVLNPLLFDDGALFDQALAAANT
ncbi:MAG: solute-binding protein, partial [Synechococcaceae cyanobacterium SM2_3_60]|nr:solute-binding protein [Synechococcaceae cyanobacterium SM2_3_60]